jgi:hypothetical protein
MKFEIRGDRLDLADELEDDFRKEARAVVREGVDMLIAETKANLQKLMNQESRPDGPPAYQTGDLFRSIRRGRVRLGRDKRSVSGEMVSTLSYEEVNGVEYGHVKPDGTRVEPRPFIRPAMAETQPKIQRLFEERL